MKPKILISASSKAIAERMLNEFYYSTTYILNEDFTVSFKDGIIRNELSWSFKNNKFRVFILPENK